MILYTVLRSGGPYTVEYVRHIHDAIQGQRLDLKCLSDLPAEAMPFCEVIPLRHNWPGWWSKIELFRPDLPATPAIFIDLDTIVLGDLSLLVAVAESNDFASLRGFNQRHKNPKKKQNFASGVMAGKFFAQSHIYEEFKRKPHFYMSRKEDNWRHGDQGFIADCLDVDNVPRIQDLTSTDYIIGKRSLRNSEWYIPPETRLIAWSGNPRLHAFDDNHIMAKLWRGKQWI